VLLSAPSSLAPSSPTQVAQQRWPWWPLLPLYPYGRRRTLLRELIPGEVWSFEQLQGIFYVAVPIRMTVLRLRRGLLLYAPLPPTAELLAALRELEKRHGPVCTIVLPTASGLEHKLPTPALARAFPTAQVWVTPGQWSFPLSLPPSWLGFPAGRTRVLFEQGLPHEDELVWRGLGPLDLGLGKFMEVACLHRVSGSLLITDALVAIGADPPAVFDADPTPLLFHARERGDQPLEDTPEQRRRGWQRLVLFASYLRPAPLEVPGWGRCWPRRWLQVCASGGPTSACTPSAGNPNGRRRSVSWCPATSRAFRWRRCWSGWCFPAAVAPWCTGSNSSLSFQSCAG
jgi:hypothetical protein